MSEQLYIDCCGYASLTLNESAGGVVKFRGKFQEANIVNKNKRLYTFEVLNSNVDKLAETIESRGLLGECDHPCLTSPDFQVFTVNGWKQFTEIREGDYVYSRLDGHMVKSRVNAIIDKPYDGSAYKVKGQSIDCTFTPNHRFLLSGRQDRKNKNEQLYATIREISNNLSGYSHTPIPKTATWNGNVDSYFTLPGSTRKTKKNCSRDLTIDTMKFVAFLGIYLAEGCLSGSSGVEVWQSNESGKKLLRELLPQLHPNIEWKENERGFSTLDARLYDYLVPLGNKFTKYIPAEVKNLDVPYLEELIHWFAVGDGRMMTKDSDGMESCKAQLSVENTEDRLNLGTYSHMSVFSVSKQLVDDLHECLIKTGRCGTRSEFMPDKDYMFAGRIIKACNKHCLYQLRISRSKFIHIDPRFLHITEGHHTGRIYCLSTEHGNFYMQKKGKSFWTGNSDSIIHLANVSHLVTKLWWEGDSLYGEGEILNTPSGKVLKNLIEGGVRIGISSRGVGNGQVNNEGVLVIGESYKLITFDAVADPSTPAAFQQKVTSKKESVIPQPYKSEAKPRINTNAFISFVGQMLQSKVNEMKDKI